MTRGCEEDEEEEEEEGRMLLGCAIRGGSSDREDGDSGDTREVG